MLDKKNVNCQDSMTLNHLLGPDALENKVYTKYMAHFVCE